MMRLLDRIAERFVWIAQAVIVLGLVCVGWFALDRASPFSVLSVEPAAARPGEVVTITARVWRDQSRDCGAHFARYVFDSDAIRHYVDSGDATDAMIDRMERNTPGILRVAFVVPPTAVVGTARLETVLLYACNPVHRVWPIEVTTEMPFEVLP